MANVPQFGNWSSGDQVPYTVCFEKARKRRGGPLVNPNDPRENPSAFGEAPQVPDCAAPNDHHENPGAFVAAPPAAPVPKHDPLRSAEALRKPTDFPGQLDRGGTTASDLAKRGKRENGGGDRTAGYASPQPYHEERVYRRDSASETKNSTDGGPRLKNRSAVRADNVGTGPAIPKFGAWNEADPSASAGYTGIFDQVRVDRLGGTTGARRAPAITVKTPDHYAATPRQEVRRSWIHRCFGM
ncbi:RPM1-interacting protein 4-like [Nymphaea colorata]|nr:RPM1-interacting protein 4-like [Nymphaea colorata]